MAAVSKDAPVQLFHLLYFSHKCPDQPGLTQADQDLFREKNMHLGLTGLLVEYSGIYLQVIEGRRSEVSTLLNSMIRDTRHSRLTIVRAEQIDQRFFDKFEMNHIGEDAVSEKYVRLHFPDQAFCPVQLTGNQLWTFMADLV
ncbi:MAG: BLUF domain-containing protein [Pseudomonadota bacterium]